MRKEEGEGRGEGYEECLTGITCGQTFSGVTNVIHPAQTRAVEMHSDIQFRVCLFQLMEKVNVLYLGHAKLHVSQ